MNQLRQVKDVFATFVSCIDLGLSRAASRDGLALRLPMERAVEPLDKARHGAGFEEWQ